MNHTPHQPHSSEIPALARLWHDGWHRAHRAHVPPALTTLRTLESFEIRLADLLHNTRMIGPPSKPQGFCIIKAAEIYQIFVAKEAEGKGVAAALMTDGLNQIRAAGHKTAHLDVIPENHRAIAFYEKMGWHRKETKMVLLDTLEEPFALPCLMMIKTL